MQKRTFLTDAKPVSIDLPVQGIGVIIINATDKDCVVTADNGDTFPCPAKVISTWSLPPTLHLRAVLSATPTNNQACNVIFTDEPTLNSTSQLATLSTSSGGGLTSGAIIAYGGAVAPTGAVICDGTHYNSVLDPTFAPLFAVIGILYGGASASDFAVPDLRGRVPVGLGTNVLVSTLGNNDGVAVANRRPKHQHTAHSHSYNSSQSNGVNQAPTTAGWFPWSQEVGNTTGTKDGGSGVATDSLDAPAYQVVQFVIYK